MFAAQQVFDRYLALRPADPRHLLQDASWFLDVVEGEAADGHVELTVGERESVGIAALEADVSQPALSPVPFGDGQQGFGEVKPDGLAATLSKGQRQESGTASDLKHARFRRRSNGFDQ